MPGSPMQNNMFTASSGYKQEGNPFPVTSCGRRRNTGSPLFKAEPRRTIGKGKNFNKVSKDKSATGGAAGAAVGGGVGAAAGAIGTPIGSAIAGSVGAIGGGINGAILGASATLETGLAFTEFMKEEVQKRGCLLYTSPSPRDS